MNKEFLTRAPDTSDIDFILILKEKMPRLLKEAGQELALFLIETCFLYLDEKSKKILSLRFHRIRPQLSYRTIGERMAVHHSSAANREMIAIRRMVNWISALLTRHDKEDIRQLVEKNILVFGVFPQSIVKVLAKEGILTLDELEKALKEKRKFPFSRRLGKTAPALFEKVMAGYRKAEKK